MTQPRHSLKAVIFMSSTRSMRVGRQRCLVWRYVWREVKSLNRRGVLRPTKILIHISRRFLSKSCLSSEQRERHSKKEQKICNGWQRLMRRWNEEMHWPKVTLSFSTRSILWLKGLDTSVIRELQNWSSKEPWKKICQLCLIAHRSRLSEHRMQSTKIPKYI